jgi:hypothetical protein
MVKTVEKTIHVFDFSLTDFVLLFESLIYFCKQLAELAEG